jgi:hypothetical protein
MYQQFNIQQFYVLPTECIYVLVVILTVNSDKLHKNITLQVSVIQICTVSQYYDKTVCSALCNTKPRLQQDIL